MGCGPVVDREKRIEPHHGCVKDRGSNRDPALCPAEHPNVVVRRNGEGDGDVSSPVVGRYFFALHSTFSLFDAVTLRPQRGTYLFNGMTWGFYLMDCNH